VKKKELVAKDILVKLLLGELADKDAAMAESLVAADKEYAKAFSDLQLIWQGSGAIAPGVSADVDESWRRFKQGLPQHAKRLGFRVPAQQLKIAAALILLLGLATLLYTVYPGKHTAEQPAIAKAGTSAASDIAPAVNTVDRQDSPAVVATATLNKKTPIVQHAAMAMERVRKEQVCNSSSSPIEICIVQKLQCPGQSSVIPSCSRLDPDQAGQIKYRVAGKQMPGCKTVVDEIIIKKVATGETLVLNENSKPMSAKELFSYMTGEKKGDVLAGEFNSDCLAFNSRSGDFVLQPCAGDGD
jgi:hypothetical protein